MPMTRLPSLIVLASLILSACASSKLNRFSDVQTGMTKEEVRSVLGAPSSTFTREVDDRGRVVRLERWQYGDTPGTFMTGALFSEYPSNRVWAIYFDEAGVVLDVAEPQWETDRPEPLVPSPIPPRDS